MKTKTKSEYRDEALILLEVVPDDLFGCPRIEHLFRPIGGTARVWEYLEGSEEPEARSILKLRSRLNKRQTEAAPFEAFCLAAKISPKRMFGVIATEVAEQSAKATALLAKARHPDVVEATIGRALSPLGTADAKMLHQAMGFVPVPKNSVTIVHGNVDARNQTANVAVLPALEDTARRISDRFLQMKTPESPPQLLQADEEEDDDED